MLELREAVDDAACEDVDELDLRVANDAAPRRADVHGCLQLELKTLARRCHDNALACDRVLHRERRRHGAEPVVAFEPTRDRVAAEVDDVAAAAVELVDQGLEDAVEIRRQELRGTMRSELA